MNSKEKYLKYKSKYLKLKKQFGGTKVITKHNSGSLEGMSNQCFWISILDYLHNNGHPNLTLRELRAQTNSPEIIINGENQLVDTDIHRNAIEQIAFIYNLTIKGFPVDSNGNLLYGGNHGNIFGNGPNIVNIANFGLYHFELIINQNSNHNNFIPLVPVKGKLTKLEEIPPIMKDQYKKLSENQGELQIMKYLLKEANTEYERNLELRDTTIQSKDINNDEKNIFSNYYNSFLDNLVTDINLKEKRINELTEENATLQEVIRLFELGRL